VKEFVKSIIQQVCGCVAATNLECTKSSMRMEINMDKNEFLSILKKSLEGEVSPNIIKQNIDYDDQYIGGHQKEEEKEILNKLGDPKLIARTIIDTEKLAKQKSHLNGDNIYGNVYSENVQEN
jgi:uncharacterized membrane protein